MAIYSVGNQEIYAQEAWRPDLQKAILIHGWSSSSYAMSPLTALLSQRFSSVAVDLPGYGRSPPMDSRASIPVYAEMLVELIEQISEGPVVLVGHSMGGMISLTIALNHPEVVERMVLICPTISGRLSRTINFFVSPINFIERFSIGRSLVSAIERTYVGVTDRLMRPVSFADRSGIAEKDYDRLRSDARRTGEGRVRAQCFSAMRENDLSGALNRIETPALVIWGAEDNTVPLRDAGLVADEWPDADLRIIPKAGHWPHFETPDTASRLISAYLGLPLLSDSLHTPVDDEDFTSIRENARFLAHSRIGEGMSIAQRTRLAAQLRTRTFAPGRSLIHRSTDRQEMYIVREGTVEIWTLPDPLDNKENPSRKVDSLKPGQMAGELAMLDQGLRTADMIAGSDGATVLALDRERLLALAEDDPELGSRLLWNIALIMSQRVRFILWQLHRARKRNKPSNGGG